MPPRARSTAPQVRLAAALATGCLALVVLTACSERSVVAVDTSTDIATDSPATAPASPSAPDSASQTPAGSASGPASGSASGPGAADAPALVLEVDGLGVAVDASIRQLPFGTSRAVITTALTTTLGALKATVQSECGQGPRTQLDGQGLSVLFSGARFVGWTASGGTAGHLTTGDGIGVGSTLAKVRAQYPGIKVSTDSLGPEFTSEGGGLSGLLDGTAPTSKVTTIYAGETCFFR
jgi:hypothetical protein